MKKIIILSMLGIMLMVTFGSAYQQDAYNGQFHPEMKTTQKGYIDISPAEAWEMMSTSDDGVQIPIDVRRIDEYVNERILLPDNNDWIRWFPYEFTSDGPGPIKNTGVLLNLFMDHYKGKEIIIYCRTGRRTALSAQILVDNGFEGTVYNMVGGITAWKSVGLPTTIS